MKLLIGLFLACSMSFAQTALTFGGATSDRVTIANSASIQTLQPYTYAMWVYPTTLTGSRRLLGKGSIETQLNGTGGNVNHFNPRATTNDNYTTSSTPLSTTNTWHFLCVVSDDTAAAGHKVEIYHGTLTAFATASTFSVSTDGSGAQTSDAASSLTIGNRNANNAAWQGKMALFMTFNTALTLGQCRQQQFWPHITAGTVLYSGLGASGVGTQPDYTGNANAGTVTGATFSNGPPLTPLFGRLFDRIFPPRVIATTIPVLLER